MCAREEIEERCYESSREAEARRSVGGRIGKVGRVLRRGGGGANNRGLKSLRSCDSFRNIS